MRNEAADEAREGTVVDSSGGAGDAGGNGDDGTDAGGEEATVAFDVDETLSVGLGGSRHERRLLPASSSSPYSVSLEPAEYAVAELALDDPVSDLERLLLRSSQLSSARWSIRSRARMLARRSERGIGALLGRAGFGVCVTVLYDSAGGSPLMMLS